MAAKKRGLTLERHRVLGPEMARIERFLGELWVEVRDAYPTHSKPYKAVDKAHKAFGTLRSDLDNSIDRFHAATPPDKDEDLSIIYYPGGR